MKKLLEKFKSKDDFDKFCQILADRIRNNEAISDNPMLDGMVISLILTTNFAIDLFLQIEMGAALDGTRQKLEHIATWCSNNEDILCNLF